MRVDRLHLTQTFVSRFIVYSQTPVYGFRFLKDSILEVLLNTTVSYLSFPLILGTAELFSLILFDERKKSKSAAY